MESTQFKNDSKLDSIYLGTLPPHIPTLLLSALTWHAITLTSPFIFANMKSYKDLPSDKRKQWDIRTSSLLHALLISTLAFMILQDHDLSSDPLYAQSRASGQTYAIACGYFLWDIIISVMHVDIYGSSFVVHGVACFIVYLFSFGPFANYYGAVFLLFELSTPFLNINWMLDKMGLTGSTYQMVNGVFLLLSFFCVRIVYGLYASAQFFGSMYMYRNVTPVFHVVLYGLANVVLNVLNVIWFNKIISTLMKRMQKPEQLKPTKTMDQSAYETMMKEE